jgi:hypothetical protein
MPDPPCRWPAASRNARIGRIPHTVADANGILLTTNDYDVSGPTATSAGCARFQAGAGRRPRGLRSARGHQRVSKFADECGFTVRPSRTQTPATAVTANGPCPASPKHGDALPAAPPPELVSNRVRVAGRDRTQMVAAAGRDSG